MAKLIAIMGYSNAGKDTCASLLADILNPTPVVNLKFAREIKDLFEDFYGLPLGYLDTPEGKADTIPGTSTTYGQLLVDSWKWLGTADPLIGTRAIAKEAPKMLQEGKTLIFTDIRKPAEVDLIGHLVSEYRADLTTLRVCRPEAEIRKESDANLDKLMKQLFNYSQIYRKILNKDLPALQEALIRIFKPKYANCNGSVGPGTNQHSPSLRIPT